MNALLQKSSGGGLRSDGRPEEVAEEVTRNPWLLELQPSYACRRLIVQVGIINGICVNSEKKVENRV